MHAGREEKIVQLGLGEARGARETSAGCSGPRDSDSGLRGRCWGYKCTIGVGKGTVGLGDSEVSLFLYNNYFDSPLVKNMS